MIQYFSVVVTIWIVLWVLGSVYVPHMDDWYIDGDWTGDVLVGMGSMTAAIMWPLVLSFLAMWGVVQLVRFAIRKTGGII